MGSAPALRSVGRDEAIPHAPLRLDVAGMLRIIAQLAAQAPHEDAQRVRILAILGSPGMLQQVLVGEDRAGMTQEYLKQAILGRRQRDNRSLDADLMGLQVHRN